MVQDMRAVPGASGKAGLAGFTCGGVCGAGRLVLRQAVVPVWELSAASWNGRADPVQEVIQPGGCWCGNIAYSWLPGLLNHLHHDSPQPMTRLSRPGAQHLAIGIKTFCRQALMLNLMNDQGSVMRIKVIYVVHEVMRTPTVDRISW